MTPDQKRLFHHRSSSQEFLFYKTDAKPDADIPQDLSSVQPAQLASAFPEISAGKAFRDQAMVRLDGVSKFAAIAVRIDEASAADDNAENDPSAGVRMDVANAIDTVCKNDSGLWGQLDRDVFGCFFIESDETSAKQLGRRLKRDLAVHRKETVTLGIAVYPLIDFLKVQIIDNARKALDHAAFFGPDSSAVFDAVSLNISGDSFYQKGDIHGAVNEFKLALRLDPQNVNVHNSLGVCYGVLGDFENAKTEFKEAIRLDPNETMAVYNLGHVYQLMGNREKALEFFNEANGHEEDIFEVALQTGKLYLETEKPEKSKEYLEKAIGLKPESGLAYRFLGDCFAAMNLTDEAISAFKKAIRYNPNDADALSALGYLFDLQGENPEITTIFCQQSVDIAPENGLFRHRLGSLYLKRNQLEEALEQFQKAAELGHDSEGIIKKIQKLMSSA